MAYADDTRSLDKRRNQADRRHGPKEPLWLTDKDIQHMPGIRALISDECADKNQFMPELFSKLADAAIEAVDVVRDLMNDKVVRSEHPTVTLGAAKTMLDRTLGRPVTPVHIDAEVNVVTASDIMMRLKERMVEEESVQERLAKAVGRVKGEIDAPAGIEKEFEAALKAVDGAEPGETQKEYNARLAEIYKVYKDGQANGDNEQG